MLARGTTIHQYIPRLWLLVEGKGQIYDEGRLTVVPHICIALGKMLLFFSGTAVALEASTPVQYCLCSDSQQCRRTSLY